MLFKDLSIEAMDEVIKRYRDPQNPKILDPDVYIYEFKPNGELIETPNIYDRFGKKVGIGDLVIKFSAYNNRVSIFEGQLMGFNLLKKDGTLRQKPLAILGWPKNTPRPITGNGEEFGWDQPFNMEISDTNYLLIKVDEALLR